MSELWDIYDINRKKTGRLAERETYEFKEGEYYLIVVAVIINSQKQILTAKRSEIKKREPLKWELTGGGVRAGEDSLEAIIRETKEEIGLTFKPEEAKLIKAKIKNKDNGSGAFKDFWLFKLDVEADKIKFPDKEAMDAKWVSIDEFMKMQERGEVISGIDFGKEEYELALKILTKD